MGRLTDDMLAVFGIKPSDRVPGTGNATVTDQQLDTNTSAQYTAVDKDCVSCKVIGTSCLLIASAFLARHTLKSAHKIAGWRRYAFYGQGAAFTSGLMAVAYCRAFNVGLFDHTKQNRSLLDDARNDMKYMIVSLGYDLPTFLQESNEETSSETPK